MNYLFFLALVATSVSADLCQDLTSKVNGYSVGTSLDFSKKEITASYPECTTDDFRWCVQFLGRDVDDSQITTNECMYNLDTKSYSDCELASITTGSFFSRTVPPPTQNATSNLYAANFTTNSKSTYIWAALHTLNLGSYFDSVCGGPTPSRRSLPNDEAFDVVQDKVDTQDRFSEPFSRNAFFFNAPQSGPLPPPETQLLSFPFTNSSSNPGDYGFCFVPFANKPINLKWQACTVRLSFPDDDSKCGDWNTVQTSQKYGGVIPADTPIVPAPWFLEVVFSSVDESQFGILAVFGKLTDIADICF